MNKCPYCGNELQEGLVQSSHYIFFTEQLHKFSFYPNLYKEKEILLRKNNYLYPNCNALICRECKKVIIDYTNVKQEI